jgi:Calcineurin-like phosphoesterase
MATPARTSWVGVTLLAMVLGLLAPAAAATSTVAADADSFVNGRQAGSNRGGSSTLRIRSDFKYAYIRFQVPAVPADETITSATLRVFATSRPVCSDGAEVLRSQSDDWEERTITYNIQPGVGGFLDSVSSWSSNTYVSFDVTAAVTGPGDVSFVLRHAAGCNVSSDATWHSREAANDPQLVIESDAAPEPDPQCSDGVDNDSDGDTDFPDDPGCMDESDDDETDSPPPSDGVVVAVAGDIACDPNHRNYSGNNPELCQHRRTDDLLAGADAVLVPGDIQYNNATLTKFNRSYDPTWGQFASITYPSPGNHEYDDPSGVARGYFEYWASKGRPTGGAGNGYYSFDLGSWHIVSLNTSDGNSDVCQEGPSCAEGSPQNDFLEQALAATDKPCVAAVWQDPLYNSGVGHGNDNTIASRALWEDLYEAQADLIFNGHEHNYQRYAKQTPLGQATPDGIREFIVGTGGRSLRGFLDEKDPNFEFGAEEFGVLLMTLSADSYSWEFVDVNGTVVDAGGPVACNAKDNSV